MLLSILPPARFGDLGIQMTGGNVLSFAAIRARAENPPRRLPYMGFRKLGDGGLGRSQGLIVRAS
jgi:hypothetical protein